MTIEERVKVKISSLIDNSIKLAYLEGRIGSYSNHNYHHDSPISLIMSILEKDGVAIIRNVISPRILALIRYEYFYMLKNSAQFPRSYTHFKDTTILKIAPLDPTLFWFFPTTASVYHSTYLYQLATLFFNSKINYNTEAFVQYTSDTDDPPNNILHWDKKHTLKTWIYIEDITYKDGPMEVVLGSHLYYRKIREKIFSTNLFHEYIDNEPLPSEIENMVKTKCIAPAGSILIHDTDTLHAASKIYCDHSRKIIRAHTRSI